MQNPHYFARAIYHLVFKMLLYQALSPIYQSHVFSSCFDNILFYFVNSIFTVWKSQLSLLLPVNSQRCVSDYSKGFGPETFVHNIPFVFNHFQINHFTHRCITNDLLGQYQITLCVLCHDITPQMLVIIVTSIELIHMATATAIGSLQ